MTSELRRPLRRRRATTYDDSVDERPADRYAAANDSETLLRRAIDIIATARTMPLSSSPMINRDEIIELLEEARPPPAGRAAPGPVDAQGAPGVRRQDQPGGRRHPRRGPGPGRADGAAHRGRAGRRACGPARSIEAAETDARRLRHETEDFFDQRLASFEILLDKLTRTVAAGRERLNIGVDATPGRRATPDPDPRGFFDQDRARSGSELACEASARTSVSRTNPLSLNVAELLRRPGTRQAVRSGGHRPRSWRCGEPGSADADVGGRARSAGELTDGIVGDAAASASPWRGTCRRCLGPSSTATVEAECHELYQVHADERGRVPVRRRAARPRADGPGVVLLELPPAPLCRADCAGICPVCGPTATTHAVRAARRRRPTTAGPALDALREQLN